MCPSLAQHSGPGLGLQQALGQYWQRDGMWLLPFGGRTFPVRGVPWSKHNHSHHLPPRSCQHGFPRCSEAWDTTSVTPWAPVLRRAGRGGGAGAYQIHDNSLFIYFVYISFLTFHLNKILGIPKERRPINCQIALTALCDRWEPKVKGKEPRTLSKQKPGLRLKFFGFLH